MAATLDLVLAVDVGASSVRAMVFDAAGDPPEQYVARIRGRVPVSFAAVQCGQEARRSAARRRRPRSTPYTRSKRRDRSALASAS